MIVTVEPVKPEILLKGINILETIRKSFQANWFKTSIAKRISENIMKCIRHLYMVVSWEKLFDKNVIK